MYYVIHQDIILSLFRESIMRIICICNVVSREEIEEAIKNGARTVPEVMAACKAGDDCGSCLDYIEEMIEDYCATLNNNNSTRN